jgi:glycosyltransferase involved in cell wall biosynthesis
MNDIQRPPLTGKSRLHNTLFNFLQKIVATYEIKNIKKIVVLDKRNVALAKSYYNRDSIIVRGGMDLDMFKNITIEKVFKKDRYQLFLSSIFFPWRRFEDVVDAVEILKHKGYTNFNVHINGITDRAPSYYLSIVDRIAKKNVGDYIHITTGLSEPELIQAYAKTDIFIFPNHNQTWGLAVFEAMLAGCATIVSKTSGASEILTDNENALLVNPKSPEEIAEKIALLLDDPKKLESISKNGIEFVRKNLSWKRYAQEMAQVLKP